MLLFALACTTDPEDSGAQPFDERVVLGEEQACAAPMSSPAYTESGAAWGIVDPQLDQARHEESPSVAAADLDGDGLDDLVLLQGIGFSKVYFSEEGGGFRESTPRTLEPGPVVLPWDVDGSGTIDLVVGGSRPYFLRDGDGERETLLELPASAEGSRITAHDLSPGDFDGDGVADLFVAFDFDEQADVAVANDSVLELGDDGFVLDESVVPTDVGYRHSFDATWYDDDGDGDLDVYVANDLGSILGESTLLRNEDGVFVDASDDCFCTSLKSMKGVDVGDFNHDGLPDLYLTGSPHNTLFQQLEDGSRIDVTAATTAEAVDAPGTGWGGGFLDYDNDGWLDLLSSQGDRWNEGNDNPHFDLIPKLMRQEDGAFSDVASEVGIDAAGSHRGALANDFNLDGVLDILFTNVDGAANFYVSDGCTEAAWLEVEAPFGSRIEVVAGGFTQTDWSRMDQGYTSYGPKRVHFGLGTADTVESLSVTLPDGERIEASSFAARRRVEVAAD